MMNQTLQLSTFSALCKLASVLVLLIFIILPQTSALRCYTCAYNKGDEDSLCLTDPVALDRTTDCDKKYCTIIRQETVKPREVVSFSRGCEDVPVFLDKVVQDFTFKTYFRSCTSELCNDSDGISNKDKDVGSANNTIIKGKNSATRAMQGGVTSLVILIISMAVF